MFELHPRLKQDLLPIKKMEISTAYLLPDSDNPWVVLVPEVVDVKELHELTREQQALLMEEINHVSHVLKDLFKPDKLNIGALGNMVPQLHIHIICRFEDDRAWPNAIWGTPVGEDEAKIAEYKAKIKVRL